jgi:hypothetical protein
LSILQHFWGLVQDSEMVSFTSMLSGLSILSSSGESHLCQVPADLLIHSRELLLQAHWGVSLSCTKECREGLGTNWEPHLLELYKPRFK